MNTVTKSRAISVFTLGCALALGSGIAASAAPATNVPCLDEVIQAEGWQELPRENVATFLELSAAEEDMSIGEFCAAVRSGDITFEETSYNPGESYDNLNEIRKIIYDAGVNCAEYQEEYNEFLEADSGICAADASLTDGVVFSIISPDTQELLHAVFIDQLFSDPDDEPMDGYVILGPNWIVMTGDADNAEIVHDALGGELAG